MKEKRQAVISIFYTDTFGKIRNEAQGKFFYIEGKPVFLADMTPNKLFRKFNGYSIAKRVIEAFSEEKQRVQIIYRLKTKGTLYYAKPSDFTTKGILVSFGGHQQYILPIKNFTAKQRSIEDEPKNLPIMDVEKWKKALPLPPQTERAPLPARIQAPFSLSERFKQVCEMKGASYEVV